MRKFASAAWALGMMLAAGPAWGQAAGKDQQVCYDDTGKIAPYVMEAACTATLAQTTLTPDNRRKVMYRRAAVSFGNARQMIADTANRKAATAQGFADIDALMRLPEMDAASKAEVLRLKSQGQRALLPGGDTLADATLAEALRINPDDPNTFWIRAETYENRGNYTAALADWDRVAKVLEKDPGKKKFLATALNQLCWLTAAELNRDYAAARAYCDRGIAASPSANLYDSRGMVGLRERDDLRAYADYAHAVELEPKNASALFGLGVAERRLGRTAEGDRHIAAAKAIKPDAGESYRRFGITP